MPTNYYTTSHSRIAISVVLSCTLLLCTASCKTQRKAIETIDNRAELSQESKENSETKTLVTKIDTTDFEYYKIEYYPPSDCITTAIKSISGLRIAQRVKTDENKEELIEKNTTEQITSSTKATKKIEHTSKVSSFNWLAILAVAIIIIITLSKILKR